MLSFITFDRSGASKYFDNFKVYFFRSVFLSISSGVVGDKKNSMSSGVVGDKKNSMSSGVVGDKKIELTGRGRLFFCICISSFRWASRSEI